MRWPWRPRAKGAGRVVFIGTSPFDVAAAIDAVPTPSPAVAAWVPDEPPAPAPEPPAPPVAGLSAFVPVPAPPAEEPRPGVQLGFADGTVVTLDDADPRAVALRAAAARLTATS